MGTALLEACLERKIHYLDITGEISVRDLAQTLIDIINPGASIEQDDERLRPQKSEVFRLYGSNEKLRQHTDWNPRFTLKDGLSETVAWFRKPENLRQYKSKIYNV